jgi:hypothetical protein
VGENEPGRVEQVLRPAGAELELQQAVEVHHLQPARSDLDRQRLVPGDRHEGRQHVERYPVDLALQAGEAALEGIAPPQMSLDPGHAQAIAGGGEGLTRDEVQVVGGAHVAVHAHGEPSDQETLVRAQQPREPDRRPGQGSTPAARRCHGRRLLPGTERRATLTNSNSRSTRSSRSRQAAGSAAAGDVLGWRPRISADTALACRSASRIPARVSSK